MPNSSHSWMSDSNYGGTERNADPKEKLHYGEAGQNMEQDLPEQHPRPDVEIRAMVAEKLRDVFGLTPEEVGVAVHEGEVLLSGNISSPELRQRIQDSVEGMKEVIQVKNDLAVENPN